MSKNFIQGDGRHPDFARLVGQLEAEYLKRFAEISLNYQDYNAIQKIPCTVVFYEDGEPAACGGFNLFGDGAVELKRMYVCPKFRRRGLATKVIRQLEQIAARQGKTRAVLVTGSAMKEAIAFYESVGYRIIPSFEPFTHDQICLCMEKELELLA